MHGPVVLIVEDQKEHAGFLKRVLQAMYEDISFHEFADANSALTALPHLGFELAVVDLAIPAGTTGLSDLPGLDVVKAIQGLPSPPAIVIRTGFGDEMIPAAILNASTQHVQKGDSPARLVDLVGSFLAVRGHQASGSPHFLTPEHPLPAGPRWLTTGIALGALPSASSLWVASVLQVTSTRNGRTNAVLVALGAVGGLLVALSLLTGHSRWARLALISAGLGCAVAAGLILPFVGK